MFVERMPTTVRRGRSEGIGEGSPSRRGRFPRLRRDVGHRREHPASPARAMAPWGAGPSPLAAVSPPLDHRVAVAAAQQREAELMRLQRVVYAAVVALAATLAAGCTGTSSAGPSPSRSPSAPASVTSSVTSSLRSGTVLEKPVLWSAAVK